MPRKPKDLSDFIGKKFNSLTILESYIDVNYANNRQMFICQCDCNNQTITKVRPQDLINNKIKSCGCLAIKNRTNYIGKRFGKLVVLENVVDKYFLTICDCGNKKIFPLDSLKYKNVISCGCLRGSHRLSYHSLYRVWTGIKERCYYDKNINYKNYGGRGIKVCKEWLNNFQRFYNWCMNNGWEKGLQIDRENNDGNYEPSNCHFITHMENQWNTKLLKTNNKTGYRGVFKNDKMIFPYLAYVTFKKKRNNIGWYQSPISAAISRDLFCIKNKITLPLNFYWIDIKENQNGWINL